MGLKRMKEKKVENEKVTGLLEQILKELQIMNKNWADKEFKLSQGSRQAWSTPSAPTPQRNEPQIPDVFNMRDHQPSDSKL